MLSLASIAKLLKPIGKSTLQPYRASHHEAKGNLNHTDVPISKQSPQLDPLSYHQVSENTVALLLVQPNYRFSHSHPPRVCPCLASSLLRYLRNNLVAATMGMAV